MLTSPSAPVVRDGFWRRTGRRLKTIPFLDIILIVTIAVVGYTVWQLNKKLKAMPTWVASGNSEAPATVFPPPPPMPDETGAATTDDEGDVEKTIIELPSETSPSTVVVNPPVVNVTVNVPVIMVPPPRRRTRVIVIRSGPNRPPKVVVIGEESSTTTTVTQTVTNR